VRSPSRPGGREVHGLLQDAPRQRGVTAFVMGQARLVDPPHQVFTAIRRRGAAGHLPEFRRRLRRSPGEGQSGGLLEGGGNVDVRPFDGQRQVPGSLLRIVDDRREPRVQLSAPGRRDLLIHGGCEEGMGEPDAVTDDLDDAVLERRIQATVHLRRIGRGRDRIQRRGRQGRDYLERCEGLGGKAFEAVLDELLKPLGDRGPFAGRDLTSTPQERASDLLGEERIAA
jgi:hypothetical protein